MFNNFLVKGGFPEVQNLGTRILQEIFRDIIDFVVGERTKEIIQVCYDVSDPDTKSREVSALLEGAKNFGLKEAKIITYVFEDEEIIDGIKIQYIPFWIWALDELK